MKSPVSSSAEWRKRLLCDSFLYEIFRLGYAYLSKHCVEDLMMELFSAGFFPSELHVRSYLHLKCEKGGGKSFTDNTMG